MIFFKMAQYKKNIKETPITQKLCFFPHKCMISHALIIKI